MVLSRFACILKKEKKKKKSRFACIALLLTWIFCFAAITMQRGLDGYTLLCDRMPKTKNRLFAFVRKEVKRRKCTYVEYEF
jgi:hypothetical protein